MAEYIEKDALVRMLRAKAEMGRLSEYSVCFDNVAKMIELLPAADVEEVKHGKWIGKQLDNFRKYEVTCSNCGWVGIENYDSYNDPSDFNYCPNCGAKMTED